MNSVSGFQYEVGFQASTSQGGAADLRDKPRVRAAIGDARDRGELPIVQLHTGVEYTERPTETTVGRIDLAAEAGASIVVGHHPHFAQGFGLHSGVLAIHSLGNFVFDQQRIETMLGTMAQVDMAGDEVLRAQALPIYLEDYRPRPLTGPLGSRLIRRMGWTSTDHGAYVIEHAGRGWVTGDPAQVQVDVIERDILVEIPAEGGAIVDLRDLAPPGASLARLEQAGGGRLQVDLGRDLMLFGDFEDVDTDEEDLDFKRWDVEGTSRFPCVSHPRTGAVGLCSIRDDRNWDPSLSSFRHRIRVEGDSVNEPIKDLSLYGYAEGTNAGLLQIEVEVRPSEGEDIFDTRTPVRIDPGSYPWTPFRGDLPLLPDTDDSGDRTINHRALWVRIVHHPPSLGRGLLALDDLAMISWSDTRTMRDDLEVDTPHPYDFLRVHGAEASVVLHATFALPRLADGVTGFGM